MAKKSVHDLMNVFFIVIEEFQFLKVVAFTLAGVLLCFSYTMKGSNLDEHIFNRHIILRRVIAGFANRYYRHSCLRGFPAFGRGNRILYPQMY